MGIHRHVVRTVQYDDRLYHLKELPRRYALPRVALPALPQAEGVPVVDVVGVVSRARHAGRRRLDAVLITEHLEYSVPYRLLFQRQAHEQLREVMIDALVHLLVRIHLNGFLWLDCSLSNTLFRRDAGRLSAYVVDTETGELHDELSDGQRAVRPRDGHREVRRRAARPAGRGRSSAPTPTRSSSVRSSPRATTRCGPS